MQITRGKINKATKVVIYGPEGIGKSTLASMFPDPVFIDTEGSTGRMDVARFPAPTSWVMLHEEIQEVLKNPSLCKTLIIDTMDWAEKLCIENICSSRNVKGIEDFGYGKGYTYVKEELGKCLNLLTEVIDKGINVVLTAHAMMRKFEQPDEMGAYDRWELKLSKQCAPLVKEWADMILFCNYKTFVVNVDNKGVQKGNNKAQGGKRVMYTQHHPCWDAKNRDGLPDELPMEYEAIRSVIETSQTSQSAPDVISREEPSPRMQSTGTNPAGFQAPPITEPHQMDMIDHLHEEEARARAEPASSASDTKEEVPEPAKSGAVETSQSEPVSKYFSDPERIPKALRDLMEENDVSEWTIQDAVYGRGYYPEGTLIQDMDPGFIEGVLIAAWPQVYKMCQEIQKNQAIPFN